MPLYVRVLNGVTGLYPVELLFSDHPNTSFPDVLLPRLLAEYSVFECTRPPIPTVDLYTQRVVDGDFVQGSDGAWQLLYKIEQLPSVQAAQNIRTRRSELLAGSDWTQVADAPVDSLAWSIYRQALRDVPSQAGFPYTISWPVAPE